MKHLTILVDMDDTIESLASAWVDYLNTRHGTTTKLTDITSWDISKAVPTLTNEQVYAPLFEDDFWDWVKPIDGASEVRIFFKVILPLCKPVIAALAIMTAVGHWNSWFDVYIYNPSGRFDTLQMYLRKILLDSEAASKLMNDQKKYEAMKNLTTSSVRAATTMIVTIPIVCVYPFFQKYFVSGITIGAVKG